MLRTFGPKCSACHKSIQSDELVQQIRNRTFHTSCFQCAMCDKPLEKGDRCYSIETNQKMFENSHRDDHSITRHVLICQKHFEYPNNNHQSQINDSKFHWNDPILWNPTSSSESDSYGKKDEPIEMGK